ncbi:hypothetical protein PVL29_020577 [Vitis rotundifolia]|uniref:Uncharacterized protein n=1 Tax=Vitis rotundifolia TaxID=103349 RepID=A0AA38YXD3_VITRO|nr:hypothetical protein PVL29_020577 [Vitis rotundifolia]
MKELCGMWLIPGATLWVYFSQSSSSSNGCTSGSSHHYRFALEDELLYLPSCNTT